MYVDIVISNTFNLNKQIFFFFLFFLVTTMLYHVPPCLSWPSCSRWLPCSTMYHRAFAGLHAPGDYYALPCSTMYHHVYPGTFCPGDYTILYYVPSCLSWSSCPHGDYHALALPCTTEEDLCIEEHTPG